MKMLSKNWFWQMLRTLFPTKKNVKRQEIMERRNMGLIERRGSWRRYEELKTEAAREAKDSEDYERRLKTIIERVML